MCAEQSEAHTVKTFKRVGLEASGARVVYRGGNANNGSNAGAGYVNVNNTLTNTNANIGGRLYADQDFQDFFIKTTFPARDLQKGQWRKVQRHPSSESGKVPRYAVMTKRVGNLIDATASTANIMIAIAEAEKRCNRRGSYYQQIMEFNRDVENNIKRIQEIILTGKWDFFGYKSFTRFEHGKMRQIDWNPCFRDSVIQHALYQTAGKVLEKSCILDTYSGFKKRGMSFGAERVRSFIDEFIAEYGWDVMLYVWKADIEGFYKHILIEILYDMICRKIKDTTILQLFWTMLSSHPNGLPIGNFLSQLLANFYLNGVDHWVKQEFKLRWYSRYCDDSIGLSPLKERLNSFSEGYAEQIRPLGLNLKSNVQVFPITRHGIDFMGFVFHLGETRLRKRIERKFKHKAHLFDKHPDLSHYQSVASYYGWCKGLTRGMALWNAVMKDRSVQQLYKEVVA